MRDRSIPATDLQGCVRGVGSAGSAVVRDVGRISKRLASRVVWHGVTSWLEVKQQPHRSKIAALLPPSAGGVGLFHDGQRDHFATA